MLEVGCFSSSKDECQQCGCFSLESPTLNQTGNCSFSPGVVVVVVQIEIQPVYQAFFDFLCCRQERSSSS
jgi:hypothetical protein